MMSRQDVREWINTLNQDSEIGIGEDGLTLYEVHNGEMTGAYLDIGGIPEEIENH